MGVLDVLVNLPNSINVVFQSIKTFMLNVDIFLATLGLIFVILLFYLILFLLIWIPVKIYPYYKENKELLNKIIRIGKSWAK